MRTMRIRARYGAMLLTGVLVLVVGKFYMQGSYRSPWGLDYMTRSGKRPVVPHDKFSLITEYGQNDLRLAGEMGRGVVLVHTEKRKGEAALRRYRVNVLASDIVPLNRMVPDSRPEDCQAMRYPLDLPTLAVVIPFHDEWPSILLRTVYSLVNRTPRSILKQIILVDDASTLESLGKELQEYVDTHFPEGLVTLVRLPQRSGLIKARLEGFKHVTTKTVSFFDSHMEVNVDWVLPLLTEVVKNRRTVAMAHLDYIKADTLQYDFDPGYRTRYGFDWRLVFFETFFRVDQRQGKPETEALPGVVMVGPGFVVDADYFREVGLYDGGMEIWGGENIELAWRVWMCGGQLVHHPCSKVGHIARAQPYSFPKGRRETEIHNYKRAVDVWMGDYKKYVYQIYPEMATMDAGDLSERLALKKRLQCKDFQWFMDNVWPELFAYDRGVKAWGGLQNNATRMCLDNNEYLFQPPVLLGVKSCDFSPSTQGFSWLLDGRLRTTLQCVVVREEGMDRQPFLQDCIEGPQEQWEHHRGGLMIHTQTKLCLEILMGSRLVMHPCNPQRPSQLWSFKTYVDS